MSFTTVAVVMAEVFVAALFYVRQAATGFAGVDRTVEDAALVDGADRTAAFLRVTFPLAFPAPGSGGGDGVGEGARGVRGDDHLRGKLSR